jgi:hypothetical protein
MLIRRLGILSLLAAAVACGGEADVVATGSFEAVLPDGGLLPDPRERDCQPGDYVGLFRGVLGSEPTTTDLEGTIHFRLETVLMGEFLEITHSDLVGETRDTEHMIRARIVGGSRRGCREGEFVATLEDGLFADVFAFVGTVTGHYDASRRAFVGEWQTFSQDTGDRVGAGVWTAVYYPQQDL